MEDFSFGSWTKSTLLFTNHRRTPKRSDSQSACSTSLASRTSTRTGRPSQQLSWHTSFIRCCFRQRIIIKSTTFFKTVAALSSCASTLPTSSCSSSLSGMFSSWSRTSMPVKTLYGSTSTTKTTSAPWTCWPTSLWTCWRSLMRRATSPRSLCSWYLVQV